MAACRKHLQVWLIHTLLTSLCAAVQSQHVMQGLAVGSLGSLVVQHQAAPVHQVLSGLTLSDAMIASVHMT